jgi:UDP-2,4-diacetamido-2,4,6-trideoxy-beta-L-altropyranose hydrolase
MKKALFRVDANPEIGLGHLMRCLALAQHLVEKHVAVTFAVFSSSLPFCRGRGDWVGDIYAIPEEQAADNGEHFKNYINRHQFDWVILDGYTFSPKFRQMVSESCAQLAVFDDENNSGHLYADVVINGSSKQATEGYKLTAPLAKLCVGEEYRVLRSEFTQLTPMPWKQRQFLTIVFGGSDPFNMTIPLLLSLESLNSDKAGSVFPPIKVLTGPAYSKRQELENLVDSLKLNVEHIHDSQCISSVLNESMLVISAAGGTQFELLACHTPAILVIVAENQRLATLATQKQGWCRVMSNDAESLQQICHLAQCLCQDPHVLNDMHQKAKIHADTKGTERIIDMMQLS